MQIGMIEKHMSIRPIIGLAGLACLLGCGRKPTLEECATAWRHALEVQIDEIDPVRMAEQFSALGKMNPEEKSLMAEKLPEQKQWLKGQIPSLLRPELLSHCQRRMKRSDVDCTLAATSSAELVHKCRWKPTPGARGMALGWE